MLISIAQNVWKIMMSIEKVRFIFNLNNYQDLIKLLDINIGNIEFVRCGFSTRKFMHSI